MPREKEVWRDIFELYRDLPCLWKTSNNNYLNKDMRSQALFLLLEKYKTFDPDATLQVFKKKLENMRTSYGREKKKVKNSTQTGASADDTYQPTLWYYELLTFLDEKDEVCRTGIDTMDFSDEGSMEAPSPSQPKKKKLNLKQKQEALLDSTNILINTKEDDWELIGRSLGVQLKDLSANQKPIAKKLMSDVIFYGSIGKLTNDSSIYIPNPCITTPTLPTSFPIISPQNKNNESQVRVTSPRPCQNTPVQVIKYRKQQKKSCPVPSAQYSTADSDFTINSEYLNISDENQYPSFPVRKFLQKRQSYTVTSPKPSTSAHSLTEYLEYPDDIDDIPTVYEGSAEDMGNFIICSKKSKNKTPN